MRELKVIRMKKVYRGHQYPTYKKLPVIILKGLYLSNFGFQIGDEIKLELKYGEILIKKYIE